MVVEFTAEKHCSEIIRGIFNRPQASGRTGGYLVRLRCSIKAAVECQVGAERKSGDYKAMAAQSRGNGLALRRWPSDIQACIFWISLEWLGQRQAKDRSNNYFLSSTCFFFLGLMKAAGHFFLSFLFLHIWLLLFFKSQNNIWWLMQLHWFCCQTFYCDEDNSKIKITHLKKIKHTVKERVHPKMEMSCHSKPV